MIRQFGIDEFIFILSSARWTLVLTLIALSLGGVLGFIIALARVSRFAPLRILAGAWIGLVQGVPVLMLLFLSYFGLALAGLDLPPMIAAGISLSLYAGGFLGEIWRGAIQSVPHPQWESSSSSTSSLFPFHLRYLLYHRL